MSQSAYKIIFKNAAVLMIGRLISRIMQFLLLIYAARQLGVTHFGIFSFAYVYVRIFDRFMDMGISKFTIQQVSRETKLASRYLGANLITKVILVVLGYALMIGTAFIVSKDALTITALAILALTNIFDNFSKSFNAMFRAHEEMRYQAIIIVISNFFMTLIGFAFLFFSDTPRESMLLYCVAFVLGGFFRFLFGAFLCIKKYGMPTFDFDLSFIRHMLIKSAPFVTGGLFVTLYYNVDTVILKMFHGIEMVAFYNAAYRLVEAPLFVSDAIRTALFPTVSRMYKHDTEKLNDLVSEFLHKGFALGVSAALLIAFLSEEIVLLLFGNEYGATAHVLPVLVFSVALIMPSTICGQTIRAADRQHLTAIVTGTGLLLNIILNFILIPKYSYLGAAWATLATELLVLFVYEEILRRSIGRIVRVRPILQLLILCSLLLLFLYITQPAGLFLQLIGYCLVFVPCALLTGVITQEEVKKIFSRKRKAATQRGT